MNFSAALFLTLTFLGVILLNIFCFVKLLKENHNKPS